MQRDNVSAKSSLTTVKPVWIIFSYVEILNMDTTLLLLLFSFTCVKCDFGPYRSVDLTHTQDEKALGWSGFPTPLLTRTVSTRGYTKDLGFPDQWIEAYEFTQQEHVGTHMDAPLHFVENGRPIDQIPMEQLAGNGKMNSSSTT